MAPNLCIMWDVQSSETNIWFGKVWNMRRKTITSPRHYLLWNIYKHINNVSRCRSLVADGMSPSKYVPENPTQRTMLFAHYNMYSILLFFLGILYKVYLSILSLYKQWIFYPQPLYLMPIMPSSHVHYVLYLYQITYRIK